MTEEEEMLLKALSKPPKCMHPLEFVIDQTNKWKCNKCGLVAPKVTQVLEDTKVFMPPNAYDLVFGKPD